MSIINESIIIKLKNNKIELLTEELKLANSGLFNIYSSDIKIHKIDLSDFVEVLSEYVFNFVDKNYRLTVIKVFIEVLVLSVIFSKETELEWCWDYVKDDIAGNCGHELDLTGIGDLGISVHDSITSSSKLERLASDLIFKIKEFTTHDLFSLAGIEFVNGTTMGYFVTTDNMYAALCYR